jgi:hypothetical protein
MLLFSFCVILLLFAVVVFVDCGVGCIVLMLMAVLTGCCYWLVDAITLGRSGGEGSAERAEKADWVRNNNDGGSIIVVVVVRGGFRSCRKRKRRCRSRRCRRPCFFFFFFFFFFIVG